LIRLALKDLTKAERTKGYSTEMDNWHTAPDPSETLPEYDPETCKVTQPKTEPCQVCLAGSVMAFSLNVPRTCSIQPEEFPAKVASRLLALNSFRIGAIQSGLMSMGVSEARINKACEIFGLSKKYDDPAEWSCVSVVEYADDPDEFKKQMRAMARKLASIGL
jgi:hypothetical protein